MRLRISPPLHQVEDLKQLIASHNAIAALPDDVALLTALSVLDLSHNRLKARNPLLTGPPSILPVSPKPATPTLLFRPFAPAPLRRFRRLCTARAIRVGGA